MKNYIYVLAGLLTIGIFSSNVLAQEVHEGEVVVETSYEVAPLQQVELEEPRLSTGANGEKQTYLSEGEEAPWPGVLLNPPAIAFIVSEYESLYERAKAAIELQRQMDQNRLELEVGRLQLRLEYERREHEIITENLRSENNRLAEIHEDYVEEQTGGFWNSGFGEAIKYTLIVVGSVSVGIVAGYVIGGGLSF